MREELCYREASTSKNGCLRDASNLKVHANAK